MMSMVSKQNKFAGMSARLIVFAQENGYEITYGDAYRDPRIRYSHPDSLHGKRLAVDFNLFKNGEWLITDEGHAPLHDFWESIGGAERIPGDANHYSLEHEGMR